jgi:hypothetical protein
MGFPPPGRDISHIMERVVRLGDSIKCRFVHKNLYLLTKYFLTYPQMYPHLHYIDRWNYIAPEALSHHFVGLSIHSTAATLLQSAKTARMVRQTSLVIGSLHASAPVRSG